uniref:FHA domain-containing protein n=1 Tax=Palpitomonas bilix TaxID=652834 RepID=A0A7S3CXT0_9EUKA|mmetsp:Transcript_11174/g.29410  ORF Transcript_11174/g.29410 Transcript_11174/m.29410 type:complete len:233 (+) Transcript_11174:222-920(+)
MGLHRPCVTGLSTTIARAGEVQGQMQIEGEEGVGEVEAAIVEGARRKISVTSSGGREKLVRLKGRRRKKKKRMKENNAKPDFKLSGSLNKAENTVKGTEMKYAEPPEARKPTKKFLFFVFKGEESLDPIQLHRQSHYLIGRDRNVVDVPIDHLSCSKQHAVLQYRQVVKKGDLGEYMTEVKPYLIDLESSNGTFINKEKLEPARYYELKEKDLVKFGLSSRDYIMMSREMVE